MRLWLLPIEIGALLLVSLSAAPSTVTADVPHTTTVAMSNTAFVPPIIEINVGETVVWTNLDTVVHTVTSTTDDYNVSSSLLQRGDKFSFTFDKAGILTYYCAVHPFMVGRIYVGVAPPPSGAVFNPASPPGLSLSVSKAGDGGVSLTASLNGVEESQAAGVPVSFFGRYQDNSSTFWLKLETRSTGSNGSAQLTLPRGTATAFQAFAPQVGNLQAAHSNVVELGTSGAAASSGDPWYPAGWSSSSFLPVILVAGTALIFLTPLLLRRSRG